MEMFYDQYARQYVWSDGVRSETKDRPVPAPVTRKNVGCACRNCGAPKNTTVCEYCRS